MPPFQLPVAIALAASGLVSLAVFWLMRPKEGKIQLPIVSDDLDEPYSQKDPFDVTRPEDVVDGEPIDEAGFWARVRSIFISICQRPFFSR